MDLRKDRDFYMGKRVLYHDGKAKDMGVVVDVLHDRVQVDLGRGSRAFIFAGHGPSIFDCYSFVTPKTREVAA